MLLVPPAGSYKDVPWDWIQVQFVYTYFRENRLHISELQMCFPFKKVKWARLRRVNEL